MRAATTVDIRAGAAAPPAGLDARAQILSFEPGLYAVELVAQGVIRSTEGITLPFIRLDAIRPRLQGGGRAYVAAMSDDGLVLPGSHPAYIRVSSGTASVLLTVYKAAGTAGGPELRIRLIDPAAEKSAPPGLPSAGSPSQGLPSRGLPSLKLTLMAHVERTGDVAVPGGSWAGQPGGQAALEGFAITPDGELGTGDIEYQAMLGKTWNTPWMRGGEYCGSRGMSLPLLGVRARLIGPRAAGFRCVYWASFAGEGEIGPIADGELCAASGAPLEALRVVIEAAGPPPAPPGDGKVVTPSFGPDAGKKRSSLGEIARNAVGRRSVPQQAAMPEPPETRRRPGGRGRL